MDEKILLFKRSSESGSTANSPKYPATLEIGEVAINYGKGHEALFMRNNDNEILSFSSDEKLIGYMTDNFQEKLVSGTNIKTINNQSILGNGNITIEGGASELTLDDVSDGTTRKLSDYTTVTSFSAHTGDTTIHVTTNEKNTWNGKQDAINDLTIIRNNASSGASAYTAVTAHTGNTAIHLPTVSSTDNGKILQVVNGVWTLVTPTTIYTGSGVPDDNQGNNGDIYLQTS